MAMLKVVDAYDARLWLLSKKLCLLCLWLLLFCDFLLLRELEHLQVSSIISHEPTTMIGRFHTYFYSIFPAGRSWPQLSSVTRHSEHCWRAENLQYCLQYIHTFLAKGDLLISLSAVAPRSNASGSKRGGLLSDSQKAMVLPAAKVVASPVPIFRRRAKSFAMGARQDGGFCNSTRSYTLTQP